MRISEVRAHTRRYLTLSMMEVTKRKANLTRQIARRKMIIDSRVSQWWIVIDRRKTKKKVRFFWKEYYKNWTRNERSGQIRRTCIIILLCTCIFNIFSFSFLFTRNFLILDKTCGSKNWGGPTLSRRWNDDRSPSRRRHSQIPIYKNIHMSNLLIRYAFLSFCLLFYFFYFFFFVSLHVRCNERALTRFLSLRYALIIFFFVFLCLSSGVCSRFLSLFLSFLFFSLSLSLSPPYNRTIYNVVYALCIIIWIFFFYFLITRTSTYSPFNSK